MSTPHIRLRPEMFKRLEAVGAYRCDQMSKQTGALVIGELSSNAPENEGIDEEEYGHRLNDECPTCHGKGTVNPLTAPNNFFCTGTTDCPNCDGLGKI